MDREGGSSCVSFYSVLGIGRGASSSDVRSAYRKLALVSCDGTRILKHSTSRVDHGIPAQLSSCNLDYYLKWHPDRCEKNQVSAEEAKQRFQTIQEAYSVLSDQMKRAMYNAGVLSMYENQEDEGMKEFMRDLFSRPINGNAEMSLEEVKKMFMELFGADLAKMAAKNKRNSNDEFRASGQCH